MATIDLNSFALQCPLCGTKNAHIRLSSHLLKSTTVISKGMYRCEICHDYFMIEWAGNQIYQTHPKQLVIDVPTGTPDRIAQLYTQGMGQLQRGENDAAAMSLRKSMELSMKMLMPEETGMLNELIRKFADQTGITKSMKDWANQVKIVGNQGAHEFDPPEKKDIDEVAKFAHVFFLYAFTLPQMLKARTNQPSNPQANPNPAP